MTCQQVDMATHPRTLMYSRQPWACFADPGLNPGTVRILTGLPVCVSTLMLY